RVRVEWNALNFDDVHPPGAHRGHRRDPDAGEHQMSQFGAEKFTTRSRGAIEAAQLAATTAGNTATEPIHLLVALLRDAEGAAGTQVTKSGVDPRTQLAKAESVMTALPRATGTTVQQPAAAASLTRVLASALDLASSMKDEYVASEHLLIALAGVPDNSTASA